MRMIDADALAETLGIKAKCDDCQYQNGPFCKRGGEFVDACEAIYDAPTIEERKTGKWIHNPDPMAGEGYWNCSECGLNVYTCTDYCPNCGSDMRGDT